ncbi:MAG: purine-nucleoside phosphorylase [candidate division Zixibacteria bacterium]|nr:purine-nucleoside phosphorylase [candidate division Zixibacteria bacterium]
MLDGIYEQIKEAVEFIRTKTAFDPDVGIILGTGLGAVAEAIDKEAVIDYENIPNFPVSTVESHSGRLLFGSLSGKKVIAMQGRFHLYEGYSAQQVTFPVRVMKALGIKLLFVSNACGGLNPQFKTGDIMIITDHVNFQGKNPLVGVNDDRLGPRFPDMYNIYDKDLVELMYNTAIENGLGVQKGVYLSVLGPNLETAAEFRAFRTLGADVVGMSTIPEVIVARHSGLKVMGLSIITDMGLPDAMESISLESVLAAAKEAEPRMKLLVEKTFEKLEI